MIALLQQATGARGGEAAIGESARWASLRVHLISSPVMIELGYSSKLNAEWGFLTYLREEGRRTAAEFLAENRGNLGHRSSVDLNRLLEGV